MHSGRVIREFERRLFELGCPERYSQRSAAELAEHFDDLTQAGIEDDLEPATARARAVQELGEPTILADKLVASFRVASWWGRHPVIGFCLLPPLALMIFLPATVFALYGHFLLGNVFSRHPIPLAEFKIAVATAPAAFADWNNPLLCFIHSVPIAITTILFCKLVVRSASGWKWLLTTCAVCSVAGFFTWTGFSQSGFYLGYGSPSVYNWISAAVPLLIAGITFLWRKYRLALIGLPDSESLEPLYDPRSNKRQENPNSKVEQHETNEPSHYVNPKGIPPQSPGLPSLRGYPGIEVAEVHNPEWVEPDALTSTVYGKAPSSSPRKVYEPNASAKRDIRRPGIILKEQWFTPTSAVAAALVVLSILFVKFILLNDKVDHAKMETLRNRVWPAERKGALEFLRIRQSVKETVSERTIPLDPFTTAALTEPVGWFGETNFATLVDLPGGLHLFAGVPFAISGRVQLMGSGYKDLGVAFPSAIKGISINQKCRFLYILHGASFVRIKLPSVPDEQGFMPVLPVYQTTNIPVARLILHYADSRQAEIAIFSTQHLLDVWGPICTTEVPLRERCVTSFDTELAWASSQVPNEKFEMLNAVRLYKSRFENPRPDAEILSIDYVSTRTDAAPFLLGLTIE